MTSGMMVVKNEEKWIWYVIHSVLNVVDELVIFDTGSTDKTEEIINLFEDKKIKYKKYSGEITPEIHTEIRRECLKECRGDWLLVVDGDEVWTDKAIKEMQSEITNLNQDIEYLIFPFKNLLGDVYHYQEDSAGKYHIGNHYGHITIRGINRKKVPGLHLDRPYPYEAFVDENNTPLQEKPAKGKIMNHPFLHMTHLVRSSSKSEDEAVLLRHKKYKFELGEKFSNDYIYPRCFYSARPLVVPSPWKRRSIFYELMALIQTPFKKVKRLFS